MIGKRSKSFMLAACALALTATATAGGLLSGAQTSAEGETSAAPIAKYDFGDSSDMGRDSAGSWNLKTEGTVLQTSQGAYFNGASRLYAASEAEDISESLTNFTLNFTLTPEQQTERTSPIGFGWNNWGATKWCWLTIGQYNGLDMRFSTHGGGDGTTGRDWGKDIVTITPGQTYQMSVTAEVGGKMTVYLDGEVKYDYALPADWDLKDGNMRFAIGSDCVWGNSYSKYKGAVGGVTIYDYAMSPDAVAAYWDAYTGTEKTKAVSAELDYTSVVKAEEDATDEQILASVASESVEVSLEGGKTGKAIVEWNEVERNGEDIYIVGSLKGVYNPDGVKARAKISVVKAYEISPIAKYEFQDAENPGKDSMGNYNLVLRDADGKKGGKVTVSNGVASFDGTAGLIPESNGKDISEDLTSFTLYYEVQLNGVSDGWTSPVSFGWNNWDATKWATFQFSGGSDLLRFSAANSLAGGVSDVDGNGNQYWGKEIGKLGTEYHKVALTVQQGGKIAVYLDGEEKYSYDLPQNFTLKEGDMRFSLGGECVWGNLYSAFNGNLRNVAIYDFAMTAAQVKTVGASGMVKTNNFTTPWIETVDASEVTFKDGTATAAVIYDKNTPEEMLAKVNSATVKAGLSDGSQTELNVVWTKVGKDGEDWKVYGFVQNVGIGIPSLVTEKIAVEQVIAVESAYTVTVKDGLVGGTVTTSDSAAAPGETVTVTATPAEHYELGKIYADGEEIVADQDGKYVITVNGNVEISAVFNPIVYRVTVDEATENGTLIFTPAEGVYGTEVEIRPVADEHYSFSKMYIGEEVLTANAGGKYIVTISGNMAVRAVFVESVYVIDAFVSGETSHGSAEADKTSAKAGETVTIAVTVDAEYAAEVKVNGIVLSAGEDGKYAFTVETDSEIEVRIFAVTYAITVQAGENGNVVADKTDAKKGEKVTLTVTPAEGYEIESVKVNGAALQADENGGYSFTADGAATVEATFKKKAAVPVDSGSEQSDGRQSETENSVGCGSSIGLTAALTAFGVSALVVFGKKKRK